MAVAWLDGGSSVDVTIHLRRVVALWAGRRKVRVEVW
jgi:hypothetical protein